MTHSNHFIIKLSRTKTNKISLHLYSYLTPLSTPKVLRSFTALSNLSLHSMNLMSVLTHGTFLIKTKSHLLQTATSSRYPYRPNHIWICTLNNLSYSTNIVLLLNSVHNNILLNHIRYLIKLHTQHDKSFFVILYYTFIIKLQFFLETQDLHKPSSSMFPFQMLSQCYFLRLYLCTQLTPLLSPRILIPPDLSFNILVYM